jgi:SAM-dependent methyltransferase
MRLRVCVQVQNESGPHDRPLFRMDSPMKLSEILQAALVNLGKIFRRLSLVTFRVADNLTDVQEDSRRQIIHSTHYDMVHAADEPYYLEQYLKILSPYFCEVRPNPQIVDLGCGQGRFLFALRKIFPHGSLNGCDVSGHALQTAKDLQKDYEGEPISFTEADIRDYIDTWESGSIDLCVMTEVSIFMSDWLEVAKRAVTKVRHGGLIAMSFRPLYFNGLVAVRNKEFEFLQTILNDRSGAFDPASKLQYSWQTSNELAEIFANELNVEILSLTGIGVASGIPGDPHSSIARPSNLDQNQRRMLMDFEMEIGTALPDTGRYIFVVGRVLNSL